jgi:hypothetical protein
VVAFLAPFYFAFNTQAPISVDYSGVIGQAPLPIPLPYIVAEPLAQVQKRSVEQFVSDHHGYREKIGRRNVYIFKDMSLEDLRAISTSRLFREDVEAVANSISIGEAKVLVTLLRVVHAAILTIYNGPLALASGDNLEALRSGPIEDLDMIVDDPQAQGSSSAPQQSQLINPETQGPHISVKHEMVPLPDTYDALPAGHVFPFDESCECSDLITVPSYVCAHLQAFLGESQDDRAATVGQIRQAWPSISRTYCGYQLSHLVKVLELTCTANGVLVPLFSPGRYIGALLVTSTSLVNDSYDVHIPSSSEEVVQFIAELDTVSTRRRQIAVILCRARRRSGLPEEEDMVALNWSGVRSLSRLVLALPLTSEEKAELVSLAADVTRSLEFFLPSPDFIVKAVLLLQDPSIEVDPTLPMYHEALFHTSRLEEVLSLFGPEVPCFDIPSSPALVVKRSTPAPRSNLVSRPMKFKDAVVNWEGWIQSRTLHNGPTSMSVVLRERAYDGSDRSKVWSELVRLVPEEEEPVAIRGVGGTSKKMKYSSSVFDLL